MAWYIGDWELVVPAPNRSKRLVLDNSVCALFSTVEHPLGKQPYFLTSRVLTHNRLGFCLLHLLHVLIWFSHLATEAMICLSLQVLGVR